MMEQAKKIPQRSEIAPEDKWAIEDLYPTDEAWEEDLAALEGEREKLSAFAGRREKSV